MFSPFRFFSFPLRQNVCDLGYLLGFQAFFMLFHSSAPLHQFTPPARKCGATKLFLFLRLRLRRHIPALRATPLTTPPYPSVFIRLFLSCSNAISLTGQFLGPVLALVGLSYLRHVPPAVNTQFFRLSAPRLMSAVVPVPPLYAISLLGFSALLLDGYVLQSQ